MRARHPPSRNSPVLSKFLDAVHIIPYAEEHGDPTVRNGLVLCKLHQAAFDDFMIGVTPDNVIVFGEEILLEDDGLMLVYDLQELHGQSI